MKYGRILLSLLACASLLAVPVHAQGQYTFDIDSSVSHFEFSGTSSEGNIKGRPPRFDMDGTAGLELTPTGGPFAQGIFNGGILTTIPARLKAEIPNIFSWLPPLATIYIDDAEFVPSSAGFAINAAGNFTTDIIFTPVGGTVTVIPLIGSTEVTPLADFGPTDPTTMSGSVSSSAGNVILAMPGLDLHFADDDGMGNWVDLRVWGDLFGSAPLQNGDMTLSTPGSVFGGATATFDTANATPGGPTFLAYGLSLGSTPVPPLGVTLDIAAATQAGGMVIADGLGQASWTLPVPPQASGLTVYMQSCQSGRTSNVLTVNVQ